MKPLNNTVFIVPGWGVDAVVIGKQKSGVGWLGRASVYGTQILTLKKKKKRKEIFIECYCINDIILITLTSKSARNQ